MPVCESCGDIGRDETRSGLHARERHGRFHLKFAGVCLPITCYGSGGLQPAFCETFADVNTFVSG